MKQLFKTWLAVVVLAGTSAMAQNYVWRTVAGIRPGGQDGTGPEVEFYYPAGIAVDLNGTAYVADDGNHTVRRVQSNSVTTTIAGKAGYLGAADGTATQARFNGPSGVVIDSKGNVFVCDRGNNCIRKITPVGNVTTFAGALGAGGAVDAIGNLARFRQPRGIAIDKNDVIYIADTGNHTVRKILPDGSVTTIAGLALAQGSSDGDGGIARFNQPNAICISSDGSVFLSEAGNHTIRKISSNGSVTTIAGLAGASGNINANGGAARFNLPTGICVNAIGDLFVSDYNNQSIRKITSTGDVTTYAGSSINGFTDGSSSQSRFWGPNGIAITAGGEIFVSDRFNFAIRKIGTDMITTSIAGQPTWGYADGVGPVAQFNFVASGSVTVSPSGNIYVADTGNFVVRQIDPTRTVTTLAGAQGVPTVVDGPVASARFTALHGITCDNEGNVYVSHANSNVIRRITVTGQVATVAGLNNQSGTADGTGSAARFRSPIGLAVDASNRVLIADRDNHAIRRMTPEGIVTTIAGTIGTSGTANGPALSARFNGPQSVAVDSSGLIYVADTNNHCIRRINAAGDVETFAGLPGTGGYVDGAASDARFSSPAGIAMDVSGNVYVSEGGARIRKISPNGYTTTIGGSVLGYLEGIGTSALFQGPRHIAVDNRGLVYLADAFNNRIAVGGVMPFQEVLSPEQTLLEGEEGVISFGQSILGRTSTKEITLKNRGTAALDVQCAFSGTNASEFIMAGGVSTVSVPAGSELKLTIQHTPLGQQGERAASLRLTSNDVIQPDLMIALGSTAIDAKPFFSISPLNAVTKNPGQSMTFAALYISGLEPFTYRWRRNGTTISGATGSSYSISSTQQSHEGSYDCVITNSYGSFTTAASVLSVNDPVVIVTPPLSQSANVGQEVTLNVTATGTEPMEFQWRKNGTPLPGENAPGLVMVVDANSGGFYDVVITNPLGSVTSATAALTVLNPPVISLHPSDQNVSVGSTAFFSVTASGPGLTYQWRRNGVDLSKQTGSMLMVSNVQKANEGVYDVVVKNIFGVVLSDPARLNLPQPLSITEHPQDVTASPGDTASFAVTATGQGTLTFQWHKDGKAIKDAKSSTLNVPVRDPTAAGAYTVTVASGSLKVASAPAYLRVPEAGLLIYKFTVTGNSYEGTSSSKIALSGLLVLDRLNQRGGIIRFGKNGKLATFVTLVDDGLRTDSTGPVTNSQTVVSKVVKAEDSPEQETTTLWLRGTDGPVTFSSADKTMAPKTLSGFQTELGLADFTQVTSLSLAATLDNAASLLARQAGETVEQTLNRLAAGLQQKGFIRE